MKCYKCQTDSPLAAWGIATKACVSSSCGETSARKCPSCGEVVGHTWLDGEAEWRSSEYYVN